MHIYFFLHSLNFVKEGGRIAFILPTEWMESGYGRPLRYILSRKMNTEAIILYSEEGLAFPGVLTRASIVLAAKEPPSRKTLLVKIYTWPFTEELLRALERGYGNYDWGHVRIIDLTSYDAYVSAKWTNLMLPEYTDFSGILTRLGKVAKVVRGIATGDNSFFTLTESERLRYGIEAEYLVPVVTSPRNLKGYCFTREDWEFLKALGRKVYLLYCFKTKEELRGTRLLKYLERGERAGVPRRYTTRHRKVWYWMERRKPPDAFLVYMSRGPLRFVYNQAKALPLNTLHGVYFNDRVKAQEAMLKAILAFLNSDVAFEIARRELRVYGGGLYKVEPKEAEMPPVVDPGRIGGSEAQRLAELFAELCICSRDGECSEAKAREALNLEVKKLLKAW